MVVVVSPELRLPGFHRATVKRRSRTGTVRCFPGLLLLFIGDGEDMQFSASRPDGAPRQGISKPQCAFEVSMFTESCNSHQFSRLAALFIDGRAE